MYEAAEAALNSTRLCLNIGLTADVGKLEDRALHVLNARVAPFNLVSSVETTSHCVALICMHFYDCFSMHVFLKVNFILVKNTKQWFAS